MDERSLSEDTTFSIIYTLSLRLVCVCVFLPCHQIQASQTLYSAEWGLVEGKWGGTVLLWSWSTTSFESQRATRDCWTSTCQQKTRSITVAIQLPPPKLKKTFPFHCYAQLDVRLLTVPVPVLQLTDSHFHEYQKHLWATTHFWSNIFFYFLKSNVKLSKVL